MKSKARPVTKIGGVRRVVKNKPKPDATSYYKDSKGSCLFPKKMSQYRFVICTDMEPDAMVFLTMFTAWVRANEKFFDSRSLFPIHSFIIDGSRVKAQRAREFLAKFGELLEWNDPEHQLYKGYRSAGNRIWYEDREAGKWDKEQ